MQPLYTSADLPDGPRRAPRRAGRRSRSPAARTARCTASSCGRSASTRATRRRRSPTSATSTCSRTARRASRWPSTCRRSSAWTPTTRAASGEVGRTGVAIDTLDDMRTAFDGIPLDEVSTSMTINAPAAVLLLLYQLVGEEQGVAPERLRGTVQNDILKEYIARGNFIYPPVPVDAAHDGPVRLLRRARAALEHGLDLRLPLPREGRLGRAGGRVHAGQRHGLRAGGDRRGARGGRVRAPARLLLQRPQQRLPGGGEVPRRPADLGARRCATASGRPTRRR